MLDSLEHLNRLQVQPSSSPRLAGHSMEEKMGIIVLVIVFLVSVNIYGLSTGLLIGGVITISLTIGWVVGYMYRYLNH